MSGDDRLIFSRQILVQQLDRLFTGDVYWGRIFFCYKC
jgi:hypothetical protein